MDTKQSLAARIPALFLAALMVAAPMALVACDKNSALEEAVEEVGDEISDAGKEIKDEIDDAH